MSKLQQFCSNTSCLVMGERVAGTNIDPATPITPVGGSNHSVMRTPGELGYLVRF